MVIGQLLNEVGKVAYTSHLFFRPNFTFGVIATYKLISDK